MYYLRLARKAQSLFDEKENLARAYLQFKQSPTNESRLLKIYIGSRLSKENEIDQIATDIIKENRGNFRDCVAGLSMAEENEKDAILHYLNMIERLIPFIDDLKPAKDEIYPYQGERPAIQFDLHAPADLFLNVGEIPELTKMNTASGEQLFEWEWRSDYVKKKSVNLAVRAVNAFSSDEKKIIMSFDITLPGGLNLDENQFIIEGKKLMPETHLETGLKKKTKEALLTMLLLGGPVLFLNMIDSDRQRTAQLNITYATCAGLILITSAIFGRENVSVPIPSNIEYNRSLAREIESMKKKIFVGVKIEKNP